MPDSTDLTAVEALLAERDSLRGWLDRLDGSGVAVPESVRARVRGDYQARLDGLIEELRTHADAVADRLAAETAERDRLLDLARHAREGLAEAELRHAVGEYDAARFEQERARHTTELDGLEVELNHLAESIAGLEDVHAAVTRPTEQGGEMDPPGLDEAEPGVVETVVVEPEESPPASDESERLLSIFDEGPAAELSPPTEGADEGSASVSGPVGFGPLSFTPMNGGGPAPIPAGHGRPVRPAVPPIGIPGADQSPRFVRPAPDRGSELVELPADRHGDDLAVESVRVVQDPEPVMPESSADTESNARTLRCSECGAMNRPLEWYCEKCGAELTAV